MHHNQFATDAADPVRPEPSDLAGKPSDLGAEPSEFVGLARAEGRRAAIEEAAKVADRHERAMAALDDTFAQGAEAQARIIARDIRALTDKEPT